MNAPYAWAKTQTNLGNTLLALGERESGIDRLEEAIATYRAALEVRTRGGRAVRLGHDAKQPRQCPFGLG